MDSSRVFELHAAGATIVLEGLHRTWAPLGSFARGLAADLGSPVQVNAYVTPPSAQGFATHHDTHDVFVLQVAGRKQWCVAEPVMPLPLPRHGWGSLDPALKAAAEQSSTVLDTILEPGDALYLPRGFLHSARTASERSVHLTVGVHSVTRYEVLQAALDLAAADEGFRFALPVGGGPTPEDLRHVALQYSRWLSTVDAGDLAERVRRRRWATMPAEPVKVLAQADALTGVGPHSVVRRRPALSALARTDGDIVTLVLTDRTVSMPADVAGAVTTLLEGSPVRVGDLTGPLSTEDHVVLVRRLLRESVLVPADRRD